MLANRRTMLKVLLTLSCVALVPAAFAADFPPLPDGLTAPSQATRMPAFKLPGANGGALSAGDLRGKVAIVRFWATW